MTQKILELSADPKIRKGQFRTLAREAMATDRWSRSDPVAKVVSLLERVYAAGGVKGDREDAPVASDAPVPWDAIPVRAKEILRYAIHYRKHWDRILDGSLVVLLDGARKVVPRDTEVHVPGWACGRTAKTIFTSSTGSRSTGRRHPHPLS
jgi:hypothetical protein